MNLVRNSAQQALLLLGPDKRWRWAALVALAVIVAVLEATGAVLIFTLIGVIVDPNSSPQVPLIGRAWNLGPGPVDDHSALLIAGTVVLFFLFRSGVLVGQSYVRARMVDNASARLSAELVSGYLAMPYLVHTQRNSAELIRNAYTSAQFFASSVLHPLVIVSAEASMILALLLVLVAISPYASLAAIVVLGVLMLILLRFVQPHLRRLGREAQDARAASLKALQQALAGFRDIRLLGREAAFANVYRHHRFRVSIAEYRKTALAELPRALVETVLVIVIVVVFALAIVRGQPSDTAISTLAVFAYAGMRLQPSLQKVVSAMNELRFGSAILDDLLADKEGEAQWKTASLSTSPLSNHARPAFSTRIQIRDISFSYTEGSPALKNISLTIESGEFVGVIGPTGGGKSTLVDIIAGLLVPDSGDMLVDGRPTINRLTWWHTQIGVVSQSVFLLDDTLRANIAFGEPPDQVDDRRISLAVERAQLSSVVDALPDGLDTAVGERGVRLSGGQRQRVAIARALYREPPVIILDEGTSALDTDTESALVTAIDTFRQDRTLIAVAHRTASVADADRIVVVRAGAIVADGPPSAILRAEADVEL